MLTRNITITPKDVKYTLPPSTESNLNLRLLSMVNIKEFGAVGDGVANETTAFRTAFEYMRSIRGGVLLVPPGTYHFGSYSTSQKILEVNNIPNLTILAYGATFTATTTASVTPFLFLFTDCNNLVIKGAAFKDLGFDPSVWEQHSRWGMAGIVLQPSNNITRNIVIEDCRASNLTYFILSDQINQVGVGTRRSVRDLSVRNCSVENAYYGVDLLYFGGTTKVDLVCRDVRRGFISYGQQNTDVNIKLYTSKGFLGSNAFISLACAGNAYVDPTTGTPIGNDCRVENVNVNLDVSGYEAHTAYVHLYHQKADSVGEIGNVTSHIRINNLSQEGKNPLITNTYAYTIDHELPNGAVLGATQRTVRNASLNLSLTGGLSGEVFNIPSVNSTRPFSIGFNEITASLISASARTALVRNNVVLAPMLLPLTGIVAIGTTSAGTAAGYQLDGGLYKQGTLVTVDMRVRWASHSGTGNLRLSNLPLPASAGSNSFLRVNVINGTRPSAPLYAQVGGAGSAQLIFLSESSSGLTNYTVPAGTTDLVIQGTYYTGP